MDSPPGSGEVSCLLGSRRISEGCVREGSEGSSDFWKSNMKSYRNFLSKDHTGVENPELNNDLPSILHVVKISLS